MYDNIRTIRSPNDSICSIPKLQGIEGYGTSLGAAFPASDRLHDIASAGSNLVKEVVEVILHFAGPFEGISRRVSWTISNTRVDDKGPVSDEIAGKINTMLTRLRVYSLNPNAIAAAVPLNPSLELNNEGGYLAAVLDQLRDNEPERFEDLNKELGRWLPEFDRILFETPTPGHRGILLRTRQGQHPIPARNLSQGTLLSLAILASILVFSVKFKMLYTGYLTRKVTVKIGMVSK